MLGKAVHVLHVLAAVAWVGGLAFALVALRPALAGLRPPEQIILQLGSLTRFFRLVWHAMPILLASGYLLLFGWFGGFVGAGWHIHAMHMLALVMAGVFITITTGPWREFKASVARDDLAAAGAAMVRTRQLMAMNLVLGVAAIAVASWGSFAR